MIKHIVLWRLKDNANGNTKEQNAAIIKQRLEALQPIIPGILTMEVGFDFSATDMSADVVLYSEFESRQALENYRVHPAHVEVAAFVKEVRTERRVADYEL
jgi:hypothetical protein